MKRPTTTYSKWLSNFYKYYNVGGYRLGQHFINCFIVKEDDMTAKLWNMTNNDQVESLIYDIIGSYQWDYENLIITMKQPFEYGE